MLFRSHNKLETRSRFCCFLGYGETQKGYRCYDPVSHRLRVFRNVVFWEHRSFIATFASLVLLVSFFFSHMSITNLSLGQAFVVFLAMAKLKRGIGVMILSLIVFVSPAMLSFGNIFPLSSSLTSVPPYLPSLS